MGLIINHEVQLNINNIFKNYDRECRLEEV